MLKLEVQNPSIEVTFEDEGVAVNRTATVKIWCAGQCVQVIEAVIGKGQGADFGWYNYVKFNRVETTKS